MEDGRMAYDYKGLRPDAHLARVIRNQVKILRNRCLAGEHLIQQCRNGQWVQRAPDGSESVIFIEDGTSQS